MLTPTGRLDVFNEENRYKSVYIYLNQEKSDVYPKETRKKEVEINKWHISDLLKRIIKGEVFNGIDGVPKQIEVEVNHFIAELAFVIVTLILCALFIKSLLKDFRKGKRNSYYLQDRFVVLKLVLATLSNSSLHEQKQRV